MMQTTAKSTPASGREHLVRIDAELALAEDNFDVVQIGDLRIERELVQKGIKAADEAEAAKARDRLYVEAEQSLDSMLAIRAEDEAQLRHAVATASQALGQLSRVIQNHSATTIDLTQQAASIDPEAHGRLRTGPPGVRIDGVLLADHSGAVATLVAALAAPLVRPGYPALAEQLAQVGRYGNRFPFPEMQATP